MLIALIDWATAHPKLEKIKWSVLATNQRAIYLYDSLGFREEGRRTNAVKLGEDQYNDLVMMGRFVDRGFSRG